MKRIHRCHTRTAGLAAITALRTSTGAHGCTILIAPGRFADGARR